MYGIVATGILRPPRQRRRTRKIISGSFSAYNMFALHHSVVDAIHPNPFDRYADVRKIFRGKVFLSSRLVPRPLCTARTVALLPRAAAACVASRARSRALSFRDHVGHAVTVIIIVYAHTHTHTHIYIFGERRTSTLHTHSDVL